MIRVEVESSKGFIRRVHVDGHGGGKKGRDIVCAAVSAVAQTALQGLLSFAPGTIGWTRESGSLDISVRDCEDGKTRNIVQVILATMSMGLERIAGEHPEKVKYLSVDDPGISDEA